MIYTNFLFYSCFIGDTRIRYGIFLAPLFAVIIFNVIIFVLVARVLIKHSKRSISRAKDDQDIKKVVSGTLKTLLSVVSVMFMFGLSWLFGALSISGAAIVFQWLFVIFSTTQGFCLFIFFCVIGKDAREEWKKLLSCYRYKGEKKSTATPSGISTGSKLRSYNTKQSALKSKSIATRSVHLPSKLESSDFSSSVAELEMSEVSPIKTKLFDPINEENTSIIISNDLAEIEHANENLPDEPKPQDSQLPPQIMFRLERYYTLNEQDELSTPSPDCSTTQLTQLTQIEILDDFDDDKSLIDISEV